MLTLYTRAACPLCEEMAAAVEGLVAGSGVVVVSCDVDADPVLRQRFGWDVPLLFDGDTELARHRLDPAKFRTWQADARCAEFWQNGTT